MKEVFDFTSEDFDEDSRKYDVNILLLKDLHKRRKSHTVDKPYCGKIKVSYVTDENEEYDCIYYYKTNKQIQQKMRDNDKLNLQFIYVKDFNISKINNYDNISLNSLYSPYSFWDGNVNFSNAHFKGEVDFTDTQFGSYVQFNNTIFKANVKFTDCMFGESAQFANAYFENNVDFTFTKFADETSFHHISVKNTFNSYKGAKFSDNVSFDDAQFNNGMSFCGIQFEKSVSFRRTRFGNSKVVFNHIKFGEGDISFEYSEFGKKISFFNTQFGYGITSFINAYAHKLVFHNSIFNSNVTLRFRQIKELIVQDCTIEKSLLCDKNEKNEYVKYNNLSFLNTDNNGKIIIDWHKNNIFYALSNYSVEDKATQLLMLKDNFHNIGYYEDEDCAYKAYMDCKAQNLNWFKEAFNKGNQKNLLKGISKGLGSVFKKMFYKVFGLISGYGTKPLRLLCCSIISIIVFGLAYSPFVSKTYSFVSIFEGLYFSAITFLTIGYDNMKLISVFPAVLSSIEGFLGLFLMSFFTVAVARKLLR